LYANDDYYDWQAFSGDVERLTSCVLTKEAETWGSLPNAVDCDARDDEMSGSGILRIYRGPIESFWKGN